MELYEVEELFKNVKHGAIKAYLRNAAILRDPAATPQMKELAAANVKAIANNQPIPKPKSTPKQKKTTAATQKPSLGMKPSKPEEAAIVPYHPDYAKHYNITPEQWQAAAPEHQRAVVAHHEKALSAMPTAAPSNIKVAKSIDTLYNLFVELKKHL